MSAAKHTPTRIGSQGLREVYRWSTADKRAPNLVGKPCVLMSEALYEELVHFIEHWTHEGHLQTFEDRERFRAAAREVIAKATGTPHQGTGFLPPNLERAVNQRSESRGKK
jgi:hypothetical protein